MPVNRSKLCGVEFDRFDVEQLVHVIDKKVSKGVGGWLFTPNLSILRMLAEDPGLSWVTDIATEVVPDGQPLRWISKIGGGDLGPRVTGSDVLPLVIERVRPGTRLLIVGGPEAAVVAGAVRSKKEGMMVVGAFSPPYGFDRDLETVQRHAKQIAGGVTDEPELVVMGLSFPRQEYLALEIRNCFPHAYFLNVGGALSFWTGVQRRAPAALQRAGFEWAHRLWHEPQRLWRRYLLGDLPFLLHQVWKNGWARFAKVVGL